MDKPPRGDFNTRGRIALAVIEIGASTMPFPNRTLSPLMQVYAQQFRFDRVSRLRSLARTLTIVVFAVLVAATTVLD